MQKCTSDRNLGKENVVKFRSVLFGRGILCFLLRDLFNNKICFILLHILIPWLVFLSA